MTLTASNAPASHRRGVFFWRTPARAACLLIMAGGFSLGALNHAADFAAGGWRPYEGAPPFLEAYWSSLLGLDLLAIVLLILRPRMGLLLALTIMVSDVAVNSYAAGVVYRDQFWTPALLMQGGFMLWIAATAPWLLRALKREAH